MRIINSLLLSAVVLLLTTGTASAHRVNLFAYVEGGKIYTESYFPDGNPVKDGKLMVYDSQDRLIKDGVTNKEGLFDFDIPKVDDLTIVIKATMGHRSSFKLKKSEVKGAR